MCVLTYQISCVHISRIILTSVRQGVGGWSGSNFTLKRRTPKNPTQIG